MFKSAGQSSVDWPALLFSVYFHLVLIPINLFSPCVPAPMSILICPVTCYSLASRSFWTFLLLFSALCPFSPARFRISLWLPDVFGHFYCFSQLYVHFLLPGSVFLSGFRRILDFFTAFLVLMSIFTCSVPYFPSGFWMFLDFFPAFLGFMSIFSCSVPYFSLAFRRILDFFPCFSLLYVHFHLLSSVFPSGFTFILDFFPVFLSFMSIWKNTEDSGPRKAALRRIKRSAITAFLFQKLLFRLP